MNISLQRHKIMLLLVHVYLLKIIKEISIECTCTLTFRLVLAYLPRVHYFSPKNNSCRRVRRSDTHKMSWIWRGHNVTLELKQKLNLSDPGRKPNTWHLIHHLLDLWFRITPPSLLLIHKYTVLVSMENKK